MASLNRVMLMGNLTADPRIKEVKPGLKLAEFGLAVDASYRRKDGEQKEATVFVDVVVWGRQAEAAAAWLAKGRPVFVDGRLQLDQWKSREGENRSKLRVLADRVQFQGAPEASGKGERREAE